MKVKKLVFWSVSAVLVSSMLVLGILFLLFYCYSPITITRHSICYYCISESIRNFPVTDATEEPKYVFQTEYVDVSLYLGYSNVTFATNKTPDEIIGIGKTYFISNGFGLKEISCIEHPEGLNAPRCYAYFVGKESSISLTVDLTRDTNYHAAKTNLVSVTETYNVSEKNKDYE
jgi:hypothetical protein